jgi:hypothetical protein
VPGAAAAVCAANDSAPPVNCGSTAMAAAAASTTGGRWIRLANVRAVFLEAKFQPDTAQPPFVVEAAPPNRQAPWAGRPGTRMAPRALPLAAAGKPAQASAADRTARPSSRPPAAGTAGPGGCPPRPDHGPARRTAECTHTHGGQCGCEATPRSEPPTSVAVASFQTPGLPFARRRFTQHMSGISPAFQPHSPWCQRCGSSAVPESAEQVDALAVVPLPAIGG